MLPVDITKGNYNHRQLRLTHVHTHTRHTVSIGHVSLLLHGSLVSSRCSSLSSVYLSAARLCFNYQLAAADTE